MDNNGRIKLESNIEREVYKFVRDIKEHMKDFVMIYAMRNNLQVDKEVLQTVLKIADTAVNDGLGSKIEFFKQGISKTLDEVTETEAPAPTLSKE